MRGATYRYGLKREPEKNFNPRTPCGVRREIRLITVGDVLFQSTHPMRGATILRIGVKTIFTIFQSTHPMRGATCRPPGGNPRKRHFNPRTPCGVRPNSTMSQMRAANISIHAPHAGCDYETYSTKEETNIFQSTHPMRGATL